ncbi:polyprenyl synthetase family protein [Pseudemcibacter aquimaris]|uniref:polyprenyl synthetase family protein n=1 Tax=Pseudemcibacter aquimaris TaxID=2857064 RepID=UPI002011AE36|nr:farnesyl diphosphate synthase [Pseudemcibacter aquimaris]MCC3861317.1 polyprenyl synthetase family protein [Pseudemcibacter aquimaris]WDU58089.1 polyprenyl synthetase family protein [Pseudemcibacter aquimaris]
MSECHSELAQKSLKDFASTIEDKMLSLLPKPDGMEERVIDAMRYALLAGGKRMRPFMLVEAAKLFSIDDESAMRVAAATECIHTYSLIHDDLPAMDDDDLRRGKPTTHIKYDEATAILAGDALLTLGFEILASEKTHPDPTVRCELVTSLSRAIGAKGMVGGQMIDLIAENQSLQHDEISRMQHMKTGELIVFSCEAAAILAKVEGEKRDALVQYAEKIGLAFQIVDDLLDIEGCSTKIGKTAGKDVEAGKATFVSVLGADKARLLADELIDEAIQIMDVFDDNADVLKSLAAFVIKRAH